MSNRRITMALAVLLVWIALYALITTVVITSHLDRIEATCTEVKR